jgi:hypothetical protein
MKIKYLLLAIAILSFQQTFFAQQNQSAEWIRVEHESGEFSIEIPVKHNYFFNKDGFLASRDRDTYDIKEMHQVNAFSEKTLLSVESYKASKGALMAMYDILEKERELRVIKINGFDAKQHIYRKDNTYSATIFFHSKKHIYIVTAASRYGETPIIKRFFDSINFNPDIKKASAAGIVPFSALRSSEPSISITNEKPKEPPKQSNVPKGIDPEAVILISKSKPSYTDAARMNRVQGTIRAKVEFSQEGYISKINFTQTLPEGLLRQALFAILRIKFLPKEKNGVPETITRTVEYSFSIY